MDLPPSLPPSLLFIFLLLSCFSFALSDGLAFNFPTFLSTDGSEVDTGHFGAINQGALQLTYDSASNTPEIQNYSGRITYNTPLQLSNPGFNYSASFNTFFLLNMGTIGEGVNFPSGGGMAFILCSEPASNSEVENSIGGFLGLFNQTVANNSIDSAHRLVAIEFDTFKDSYDPDNNHVGVDLNNTVSIATESLTPYGVILRTPSDNTSVWIDYDGRNMKLSVFVKAGTNVSKPAEPVLSYSIDLRQYLPANVYLGFSGSTGIQMETHCVLAWNFTSQGFPSPKNVGLIVGAIVGAVAGLVCLSVCGIVVRRRQLRNAFPTPMDLNNSVYGPRNFTYKELRKATCNFSDRCVLGEGGFGAVYKGTLSDRGNTAVAVKRISTPCKSREGMRQFIAEVTIMGRLRHRNLVKLLGWCQESGGQLMLVYEYMQNGDLSHWLHRETELDWERRYKVMKGLATGLLYLHEEGEKAVVHRDLKPSNVLLDGEFNAKLGDFGLARLIESSDQWTQTKTTIAGTLGYMAPEYIDTGIVTKESDLFSFGSVGMEVATGRRPSTDLRRGLWQLHQADRLCEAADPRLASFNREEMERLLLVSLACCHPDPEARPDIRQVLHALSSLSAPLVVHFPATTTYYDTTSVEFPSTASSATAGVASFGDLSSR